MIQLNNNKEIVKQITQALKDNDGYCPCAISKNKDTKCQCKAFREMAEGQCHCGLFIKIKD